MKSPGQRLKYIREELLKLSRVKIFDKYGLSADTLAAWENGKLKLSEKGLERCIKIYNAENLIVTREWLLTGKGLSPKFSLELNRYFKTNPTEKPNQPFDDTMLMVKEIDFFQSLAPHSVTALVPNDDMLPLYAAGDHVGGRLRYAKEIATCIGKDCIVKTQDGATYIRRIAKNTKAQGYNLVCLNPAWNGNPEPVLFNVKLEAAAPIIWHRRQDEE
ncbi:MAG: helix-turn-helix transcriptional regulator [Gammaproteobacteria bacterium]